MPKSNFNQFLDECGDYKNVENIPTTSKISFETKSYDYENDGVNILNQNMNSDNVQNLVSENGVKTWNNLNTFTSSSSNLNSNSNSNRSSRSSFSNIFLSKDTNSKNKF